MEGSEIKEVGIIQNNSKKKIFVAGATGNTGKRIVEQLLAYGFAVKAGVRDVNKAKSILPEGNPLLQIENDLLNLCVHMEAEKLGTQIILFLFCLSGRISSYVFQKKLLVKADVTEGSAKLADAIGDDSDAVICATGFQPSWNLLAPWKVDNFGTVNLVDACQKLGVNRFILISSILVNGAAMGQLFNPVYIILNVMGLVLVAKLQAERYIRKSGINYTIIRPGGLKNDPPQGNLVMQPEDTLFRGSISRDQVAEVAVKALLHLESHYKVVEIVASTDAPERSFEELFGSIEQQ
ncbi:uncharacterized protein At2g34460, chloroplastic isoform X2 [Capsicum annuum]|uniref:uncharacterized protein At2g34460, chloroplastic isoform X2 n=1 Tax=Capsicum annuum TaxID=4072 RepID=UPI001FB0F649|nr:uncharacterized protein At2g34460, chloroplastic isoform X2 [Capsicum annuum]XP_047262690.1 uncharacterized protein At2g34460, chloroplastic isoform X2 [Capsicum annuum]XP_047262691.1 uncharacterized protein At2g34460, chloroplastic isoform X2 [Capsicum annuum]